MVRDISRLSRDEFNTDIGLIAKECYRSGARIITPEKTYNPADPADQLFLGFQGLIAGWDRANIVRRLEHHRRAKQARGCPINGAVPAGYEKIEAPRQSPAHGKLRITQDGEVRERIALILQKGLELGGVLAVVRFLHEHALAIPVMRGEDGAKGRRVIHWVAANRDRVTRILKNPAYAGAVVNGRRVQVLDRATGRRRWSTRRSYEQCVVIRDAHAVYISWDEHLELLAAIARNNQAKTYSTGEALLSGLGVARCGVCGEPMVVQYNNPTRERPGGRSGRNTPFYYVCTRRQEDGAPSACQNPAGPHIDRAVTELVLFALGQLDLEGVRETLRDRERRAAETLRLRQQRIEALARRAQMLEDAIADATRSEARARLVARFEAALGDLNAAKAEAVHPPFEERDTDRAIGADVTERHPVPPGNERGHEPCAERRVEGMIAAELPRAEDQVRPVSDERSQDLGEFLGMLTPIAVEEDGDVRVWTQRGDAGPARRPVAPPRLIDHPCARAGRD